MNDKMLKLGSEVLCNGGTIITLRQAQCSGISPLRQTQCPGMSLSTPALPIAIGKHTSTPPQISPLKDFRITSALQCTCNFL